MKISLVLGTRPEIIKMAPIIRECEKRNIECTVIYTGQHYDKILSSQIFEDLQLKMPDYFLNIGPGGHCAQTGKTLIKLEEVLDYKPSVVLVQGDTNSALAGALASLKLKLPIGHVEAGLRSYDLRMPEEYNRRLIDHMSNYLFAPTENNLNILKGENVSGDIIVTGNTVIDACMQHYRFAEQKASIKHSIKFKNFVLCTIHRTENIDNCSVLQEIVQILVNFPDKIVFSIHPHMKSQLEKCNFFSKLDCNHIQIILPVGYIDLLWLLKGCKYVLSDSGGIQEEATAPVFNKFVFVVRDKTDRKEAVDNGFAMVLGTKSEEALKMIKKNRDLVLNLPERNSPYGDGKAAEKIINYLKERLE